MRKTLFTDYECLTGYLLLVYLKLNLKINFQILVVYGILFLLWLQSGKISPLNLQLIISISFLLECSIVCKAFFGAFLQHICLLRVLSTTVLCVVNMFNELIDQRNRSIVQYER